MPSTCCSFPNRGALGRGWLCDSKRWQPSLVCWSLSPRRPEHQYTLLSLENQAGCSLGYTASPRKAHLSQHCTAAGMDGNNMLAAKNTGLVVQVASNVKNSVFLVHSFPSFPIYEGLSMRWHCLNRSHWMPEKQGWPILLVEWEFALSWFPFMLSFGTYKYCIIFVFLYCIVCLIYLLKHEDIVRVQIQRKMTMCWETLSSILFGTKANAYNISDDQWAFITTE